MTVSQKTETNIRKYVSGVQSQPTFHEYRHNRGGVSHMWKGSGCYFYNPIQRQMSFHEFTGNKQDENLFYRGNHWCYYYPMERRIQHIHNPMNLEWPKHSVFYSAHHNKWLNEHADTFIPRDARLFYNEEDWIKYKFIVSRIKDAESMRENNEPKQLTDTSSKKL